MYVTQIINIIDIELLSFGGSCVGVVGSGGGDDFFSSSGK